METYSKTELQEQAKEIFKANKCKELIATKDGQFFLPNKESFALNYVRETYGSGAKLKDHAYVLTKTEKVKESKSQKQANAKAKAEAKAEEAAKEKAQKEAAEKVEAEAKAEEEAKTAKSIKGKK